MEDKYYRDKLEKKMKALFQEKRQTFLENIPTLDFINSFPGFSVSKRMQIKAQLTSEGQIYANNDLLDYILQKDEFWMKYLETAEKINECSKTAGLILDVLNANPPNPPPPRRVSREYSEGTDSTSEDFAKNVQPSNAVIQDEQRKKEMKFARDEGSYHVADSRIVTETVEGETVHDNVQFSSKSVLINLCKAEDFTITQKEENSTFAVGPAELGNIQEAFSNSDVESTGIDTSSDSDTNNGESQPSVTLERQAEFTDTKADDFNLNRDRTQMDMFKPVGEKHLHLSDLDNDDDDMTPSEGNNEDEEDNQSFVISDADVKSAFNLTVDDSFQAPEIDSLKLEIKDQCMAVNQKSCLSPDMTTNKSELNEVRSISQNKTKLNAKLPTSGGFSTATATWKETVPTSCKPNLISSEDSSIDNCCSETITKQTTERELEVDRIVFESSQTGAHANNNNTDQQPIETMVGNHDNQEIVSNSHTAKYNNCIIIKSHNIQISSKGSSIKESSDTKALQGRTGQDVQPSLNYVDLQMHENLNRSIGNTDYSNNTSENSEESLTKKFVNESMQNTGENNLEINPEGCMQFPTLSRAESVPENNVKCLSRNSNDMTSCYEVEEAALEINEPVNNRLSENKNGTKKERNGDPDRDIEADKNNVQSVIVGHERLLDFIPHWVRFEMNWL